MDINPYSPPGQRDNIVRAELVEESWSQYTRRYFWSMRYEVGFSILVIVIGLLNR